MLQGLLGHLSGAWLRHIAGSETNRRCPYTELGHGLRKLERVRGAKQTGLPMHNRLTGPAAVHRNHRSRTGHALQRHYAKVLSLGRVDNCSAGSQELPLLRVREGLYKPHLQIGSLALSSCAVLMPSPTKVEARLMQKNNMTVSQIVCQNAAGSSTAWKACQQVSPGMQQKHAMYLHQRLSADNEQLTQTHWLLDDP